MRERRVKRRSYRYPLRVAERALVDHYKGDATEATPGGRCLFSTHGFSPIERHQNAEQSYMDEGVRILELARNVQKLFAQQEPCQKRRLIDFVLSTCSWKMVGSAPLFANPLIYWRRCQMHHQLLAPMVDETSRQPIN